LLCPCRAICGSSTSRRRALLRTSTPAPLRLCPCAERSARPTSASPRLCCGHRLDLRPAGRRKSTQLCRVVARTKAARAPASDRPSGPPRKMLRRLATRRSSTGCMHRRMHRRSRRLPTRRLRPVARLKNSQRRNGLSAPPHPAFRSRNSGTAQPTFAPLAQGARLAHAHPCPATLATATLSPPPSLLF
jgi:hypothetical protein